MKISQSGGMPLTFHILIYNVNINKFSATDLKYMSTCFSADWRPVFQHAENP